MTDLDTPLPIELPTPAPQPEQEQPDMGALAIGAAIAIPGLEGRWSVWSQSAETPGAHFLVPLDDEAKAAGVKFAVVRATMQKGSASPTLKLVRTDPYIKGLCD